MEVRQGEAPARVVISATSCRLVCMVKWSRAARPTDCRPRERPGLGDRPKAAGRAPRGPALCWRGMLAGRRPLCPPYPPTRSLPRIRRLSGSEVVQAMGLDSRFNLHFQLELTWRTAFVDDLAQQQQPPQREAAAVGTLPAVVAPAAAAPPCGEIHGDLQLAVWSEVIPPFHLMPRQVLEAGGNAVLSGMMATLHPVFLRRLGDDYSHWARDEGYRRRRAARAAAPPPRRY